MSFKYFDDFTRPKSSPKRGDFGTVIHSLSNHELLMNLEEIIHLISSDYGKLKSKAKDITQQLASLQKKIDAGSENIQLSGDLRTKLATLKNELTIPNLFASVSVEDLLTDTSYAVSRDLRKFTREQRYNDNEKI